MYKLYFTKMDITRNLKSIYEKFKTQYVDYILKNFTDIHVDTNLCCTMDNFAHSAGTYYIKVF